MKDKIKIGIVCYPTYGGSGWHGGELDRGAGTGRGFGEIRRGGSGDRARLRYRTDLLRPAVCGPQ